MGENAWLVERFEANRSYLRGVAYRMFGSLSDADAAVQEAWIRLSRADTGGIDNLRAWLTTVVGRICLNMLRSHKTRHEVSLETHVPDPIVSPKEGIDPEQEALLSDSIGLALLVVLDSLTPAERVAFVLHDIFAVPYNEIAPIVDRTPTAARQLASRARRRVQGAPVPDVDLDGQWAVVDAFLAAARSGAFDRLLAVLDPDIVLRSDGAWLINIGSLHRNAAEPRYARLSDQHVTFPLADIAAIPRQRTWATQVAWQYFSAASDDQFHAFSVNLDGQ